MRKHKITVFNETAEILGVGQSACLNQVNCSQTRSSLRRVPRPENTPYRLRERSYLVCEGGDDAAVSAKAPVDCRSRRYRR